MNALEAIKIIDSFEMSSIATTVDQDEKLKEELKNFILQVKIEGKTEKEVKVWMSQSDYKEFIRFKLFQKFIENEL